MGQFQALKIAYSISAIGTVLIGLMLKKLRIKLRVSKEEEEEKGLDLTANREKSYI